MNLRNCFLFDGSLLRPGSVEYLEEVGRLGSHARMYVRLGTLDVIVQVMSEHVDQVNRVVTCGSACMTWKQYWKINTY